MRRRRPPARLLATLGAVLLAVGGVASSGATFTAHTTHTENFSAGDWTAPVVSITAPADGAWRTTTTPAITGVAGTLPGDQATVTVLLYAGTTATGTPAQTLTVPRNGTTGAWTATPAALAQGPWTVLARQSDAGGNTGSSAAVTFRVDTVAPAPTITTPAAGSRNPATPTFAGAAGNALGDGATVQVDIYAGATATGTPVRTLTATRSGGSWTVAAGAPLAGGTYTARAAQSDQAGNTGRSAAVTFTVDATAPAGLRITAPAANASVATQTPTISGRAGNATGDATAVTVRVYAGATATGTPVRTLSATRTGTNWSIAVSPALADGQYTAQATQADDVGNTATSTAVSFRIDTVAPVLSITTPAANARVRATPTIAGAAGILTGDSATVTVRVYAGATATGTAVRTLTATRNAATGAWTLTATPALADGLYTARASQADAAGNTGQSAAVTFTVDATGPAGLAITAPAAGATVAATPLISGAAGDATGDLATVTVRIYAGATATGTAVRTLTATRTGQPWAVATSPALTSGTYTATATQADDVGNTTTSPARTFVVDATPPAGLTITAPAAGAWVATDRPVFAGAAGTATGDLPTVVVNVYAGATATGSPVRQLSTTRSGAAWAFTPAPGAALPDGQYTAQLEQSDAVGNVGRSGTVTFRVDTTAPVVAITAPADGARTAARPAITGTAGTLTGDSATVTVEIFSGATATGTPLRTLTATRNAATGAWALTPAALPDGPYAIRASQADTAGNTGRSTVVAIVTDGVRPLAQSFAAANAGTPGSTSGHLDGGDTLTFTFSEAMNPASILAGWTGAATPVRARFFNNANNDTLGLLNDAQTAALGVAAGSTTTGGVALRRNFVTGDVTFSATMTLSPDARTVTVVLGTPDVPARIAAGPVAARDMRWTTSTAARDVAGNAIASATITESDGDRDF